MTTTPATPPFPEIIRDALKFWELGRLGYNAVLASITVAWIVLTWPHFEPAFTLRCGLMLLALAAIANVLYCAAYPVDLLLQSSEWRPLWRQWRWLLWAGGTLFALLLTCYWIADEIYPHVEEAARPLW
ncbi:MAG: hypothetical protein PSW75_10800 [bacterium]|nr:hypothetical protein [bacterium]MDI1336257.1 hypothetical protein [Lacunisphaera sp.]